MSDAPVLLEMRSITKEFPGVKALSDVNLVVRAGEIHAICGENGAGKSTLMKVLSGVYPYGTYSGDDRLPGRGDRFSDIRASEHAGIVIIHQELALVPEHVDHREHLPRQRAPQARRDRLEGRPPPGAASCWPGSGCARTRTR